MSVNSIRVLVADDDPTMGLLMKAALGSAEFSVTVVDDGRAALAAFRARPFDIVLLDVEMPGLDGFEVCAAIRGSDQAGVPVVLVTSHDNAAFIRQAHELRADYLGKPINWGCMADLVRRLVMPVAG